MKLSQLSLRRPLADVENRVAEHRAQRPDAHPMYGCAFCRWVAGQHQLFKKEFFGGPETVPRAGGRAASTAAEHEAPQRAKARQRNRRT